MPRALSLFCATRARFLVDFLAAVVLEFAFWVFEFAFEFAKFLFAAFEFAFCAADFWVVEFAAAFCVAALFEFVAFGAALAVLAMDFGAFLAEFAFEFAFCAAEFAFAALAFWLVLCGAALARLGKMAFSEAAKNKLAQRLATMPANRLLRGVCANFAAFSLKAEFCATCSLFSLVSGLCATFLLKAKPCAAFLPCIFEVCLMIGFKVSFIRNPFIILAIICEVRFEFTNATSGVCFLLPRAKGGLHAARREISGEV